MSKMIGHRVDAALRGTVILFLEPNPTVHAAFQFRPDSLKTPALGDVRVRKALAYSVDKEGLNEGLFEGEGIIGHTFISPEQSNYGEIDRAITKYPLDFRRAEQMMVEAGFRARSAPMAMRGRSAPISCT